MASPRDEILAALRRRAEELLGPVADPERGWPHTERVYGLARKLAREEEADRFVVGAAALLHDLGRRDDDSYPDRAARSTELAAAELMTYPLPAATAGAILEAIAAHDGDGPAPSSLEARVLQDAHGLDALGAFGIARILISGGARDGALHEPGDPFALMRELEPDRYLIDRFFTRLLALPGRMQTPTGRVIANRRVALMLFFLEELRSELAETLPGCLLPKGDWLIPEEGAPGQ